MLRSIVRTTRPLGRCVTALPLPMPSSIAATPTSSSVVSLPTPIVVRGKPHVVSLSTSSSDSKKHNERPKKLEAAILDWSGTCADIYVIAPAVAFVEVFEKKGVKISVTEARVPMGLRKDLHIKALTEMPEIRERWKGVHGRYANQQDVDAMFADFIPAQMACLSRYTGLIPGTVEAVQSLKRDFNLKIGNTTGFQRIMVDVLLKAAKQQGYNPDVTVAGDDVEMPRPWPQMVFKNMEKLKVMASQAVVKVDDTIGGIGEGLNAGCWTVALYETSNYMEIDSLEHAASLSKSELKQRAERSKSMLDRSGAHYVIPDIRGLPAVVRDINTRLARGDRP